MGCGKYIAWLAIANERLRLARCGQVVFELKTTYRDDIAHNAMSPLVFLRRLATLVPWSLNCESVAPMEEDGGSSRRYSC